MIARVNDVKTPFLTKRLIEFCFGFDPGAHGISGNIPAVYTNIAKEFYSQVIHRNQDNRIALHEYYRDDWTFHAKGLWYYRPGMSDCANLQRQCWTVN